MRYYSLRIGNNVFTYDIGKSGLAISFSIQNFKAGESVNSQITLHNVPVYYLGQYANLYDKRVFLQAGMRRTPQNNLIPPLQDVIASGYVSSVVGEPNGIDRQMTIIFQKSKNNVIKGEFTFSIKEGMTPDLQIQAAFHAVTGGTETLKIIDTLPSPKSIYDKVQTINDIARVLQTIGLDLQETAFGFRQVRAKQPTPTAVKTIKVSDLIGQPYAINQAEVMIPMWLRGDFSLGDMVVFSPNIFFTSQSLESLRDARQIGNKSLFGGQYIVTNIQHDGVLYDASGSSWSTVVRCTKAVS